MFVEPRMIVREVFDLVVWCVQARYSDRLPVTAGYWVKLTRTKGQCSAVLHADVFGAAHVAQERAFTLNEFSHLLGRPL
ncbi:hypothetical protein [Parendozoicomonas haliclonae]|uniref:Uncharacterized protein n=1 Tax=Parendozoicomonas haliclonae TaxID=1960125 RepID=A0A1X7AEM2_9GAMM|nr:hypothetical protein [Parendozoicomonas haliclonae]SMA33431.1 hypothetical protein EHSB41UT_00280 [Parendozoicomonas haliclonae]